MSLLWKTATQSSERIFEPHDWTEMHRHYGFPSNEEEGHDDDGHEWAANYLAHATPEDPDADSHWGGELDWKTEHVPVDKIEMHPEPTRSRVNRIKEGWTSGADVPPPIYVHRDGKYHVVDGHHRSNAAREMGMTHLRGFVADSPYDDKPLPERD